MCFGVLSYVYIIIGFVTIVNISIIQIFDYIFVQSVVLKMTIHFGIIILGGGIMPMRYKVKVLQILKQNGYSTYRLINEKHYSAGSIQKLRKGEMLNTDGIATLCKLLNCQPEALIYYEPDEG